MIQLALALTFPIAIVIVVNLAIMRWGTPR